MKVFERGAFRLKQWFPAVIVGLICGSVQAQVTPIRLADEYGQVFELGEKKVKELGAENLWIGNKRNEVGDYLRQYWSVACDEAMVFFEPAMHAGELILTVACKRGEGVELDQSVPEKQRRHQRKVTAAAWEQFANRVTKWRVSGQVTGIQPEFEAAHSERERQFFNSFAPLLAVYRGNSWFVLPMRVAETADIPSVQRGRWQEAIIDLMGADRKKLDEHEQEARAWRGRDREDRNLTIAIGEKDLVKFKRAYDELKYLPKDSYVLYQRLFEALAKGQNEMVIYALRSGTPARLAKGDVTRLHTRFPVGGSGWERACQW